MKNEKIFIRKAGKEDLEGIIALLSQLSPPKQGEKIDNKTGQAILKNIIANPDYCLCTAKIGDVLAGTATLLIQLNLSHGGKPYAHVENVVTDVRFRGRGIGLAMVKFLISQASERGCYKIILNCESKNIHFYRRCGFHETGEVEMRI